MIDAGAVQGFFGVERAEGKKDENLARLSLGRLATAECAALFRPTSL
jgi:hypothetical protein